MNHIKVGNPISFIFSLALKIEFVKQGNYVQPILIKFESDDEYESKFSMLVIQVSLRTCSNVRDVVCP